MKSLKTITLGILIVPNIVFADISFEINTLLQEIFSGQKKSADFLPETNTPEIILPDNPTSKDLENFQEKIREEEIQLKQFETQVLDTEAKLYEIEQQKNTLETEIFSMDEELNAVQTDLSRLTEQESFWQKKLIQNTKQLSTIKTQTRIEKEEFNKLLNKNFIQKSAFGNSDNISIIQWIFSDKTVSQIIENQKRIKAEERKKFIRLRNLEALQTQLSQEEKKSAEFFYKLSKIKNSLEKQKQRLISLSTGKSNTLNKLSTQVVTHANALERNLRREKESHEFLVNLKKSAEKLKNTVNEQNESNQQLHPKTDSESFQQAQSQQIFQIPSLSDLILKDKWTSPLKIPLEVTAGFQDSAYEHQMGRPHLGVDFKAPQGTPIYAPKDGIVIKSSDNGFEYSYLILDHGNNIYTLYGHLSQIEILEGDMVHQGDIVALSGGTPGEKGSGYFSTGPHLHLEAFVNNQHVDPLKLLNLE